MANEKKISVARWCLPKKGNFGPWMLWFTVSKAFGESRNRLHVICFLSMASLKLLVISRIKPVFDGVSFAESKTLENLPSIHRYLIVFSAWKWVQILQPFDYNNFTWHKIFIICNLVMNNINKTFSHFKCANQVCTYFSLNN